MKDFLGYPARFWLISAALWIAGAAVLAAAFTFFPALAMSWWFFGGFFVAMYAGSQYAARFRKPG